MKRLFLLFPLLLCASQPRCAVTYRITWHCDGCGIESINPSDQGFNGHQQHQRDSWGNKVAGWPAQWQTVQACTSERALQCEETAMANAMAEVPHKTKQKGQE